jgi:hypothetical protein
MEVMMEKLKEENRILRRLLWEYHGCENLYGDDGQLQCSQCMIDFKTDPATAIEKRLRLLHRYQKVQL